MKSLVNEFIGNFNPDNELYNSINRLYKSGFLAWDTKKILNCLEFYDSFLINDNKKFNSEVCLFPYFSMVLDYNGDVKNCFYSNPIGNIYALEQIEWDIDKQLKIITESGICERCRGKIFCDIDILKEKSQ